MSLLALCGRILDRKGQAVAPWLQFSGNGQCCLRDDQSLGSSPGHGFVDVRMAVRGSS